VWICRENFTVEEQARVIVAPRSNNLLDTARMKGEFPELLGIKESLIKYVFEPNAKEKEEVKAAVDKMRDEFRAPKAGNTA
jgi:3,5-epimerase/4-reductase